MASITTTTTPTPNLFSLGSHLATHIHTQLQVSLALGRRLLSKKAAFTKTSFRAAAADPLHPDRDQMELITYNFASLYESLGKTLNTPWEMRWSELSCFPVISAWVRELKGPEVRDIRNWIAHGFNCGCYYRDIEGDLESEDVGEGMAEGPFSVSRLWRRLESEVPPLVAELEYAVGVLGEQIKEMEIEVRSPREEVVVEDMSVPEDPLEWSEGGGFGEVVGQEIGDVPAWECEESGDEGYGSESGSEGCDDEAETDGFNDWILWI
jgi:hypothetical protein